MRTIDITNQDEVNISKNGTRLLIIKGNGDVEALALPSAYRVARRTLTLISRGKATTQLTFPNNHEPRLIARHINHRQGYTLILNTHRNEANR